MEKSEIKYEFKGLNLPSEDREWGKTRFQEYLLSYPHLNNLGNSHLLEELVWAEIMLERMKEQIGNLCKKADSYKKEISKPQTISDKDQKSLQEARDQVLELKKKLGMFEERKDSDEFKKMRELEEKAAEYRRSHPLSFKVTSPFDGKIFYLKRRTEGYESFISPFYADDKVVKNTPLHKLYKSGKITKEEAAEVLGVSPEYIDWLDEKIYHTGTKEVKVADVEIPTPTSEAPPAIEEQK